MTETDPNETYTNIPTAKILLWLAMVSMVMLFAGLTSAYVVRQAEGNWTHFEIPVPFFISTILIVASSATMQWAYKSVKNNDLQKLRTGLLITLPLGFGFSLPVHRLVRPGGPGYLLCRKPFRLLFLCDHRISHGTPCRWYTLPDIRSIPLHTEPVPQGQ